MNFLKCISITIMASIIFSISTAGAEEMVIPHIFQADTPAIAEEVNNNFLAVKRAMDEKDKRIADLEVKITELENKIEEIHRSNVMALDSFITVDEDIDSRGPLVQLSGVNLQIVNGLGHTKTKNGLGNLIVGYDEINTYTNGYHHCSNGDFSDQESCEASGEIWSHSHKDGSHYLVLGSQNSYSQYGGLVAGYRNFVTNAYSTVTAGMYNTARGYYSTVSGGVTNTASGKFASISGGHGNSAEGQMSSVSGGSGNFASESYSSISGGSNNHAEGENSSISGGSNNRATVFAASVSGGLSNKAAGMNSSISGGSTNRATESCSSVSGGSMNTASGKTSSISGGYYNEATTYDASVSGGRNNTAMGNRSAVGGGFGVVANGENDWRAGD